MLTFLTIIIKRTVMSSFYQVSTDTSELFQFTQGCPINITPFRGC